MKFLHYIFFPVQALALLLFSTGVFAQFSYQGFSGGMMLHTGYLKSGDFQIAEDDDILSNHQVKGAPFGIGGTIKFHFGTVSDQFRIGMEGYRSSISYEEKGSYQVTGWGGLTFDYVRVGGKVKPFIGVNVGGGGNRNHTVLDYFYLSGTQDKLMIYHKYAFVAVTPYIGMEIAITQKLSFIAKADWLFNISNPQPDFASGPRLFLGIIFSRLK
jgi:hypothetical protein